jgi:hypothetical protein
MNNIVQKNIINSQHKYYLFKYFLMWQLCQCGKIIKDTQMKIKLLNKVTARFKSLFII